jgi:hypothetical protein
LALEHLARDLCIARLVGADKADGRQAGEEEKSAERQQRQKFGGAARTFVKAACLCGFALSERDDYCTLSWEPWLV